VNFILDVETNFVRTSVTRVLTDINVGNYLKKLIRASELRVLSAPKLSDLPI
jgi:hypothetical protein